MGVPPPTDNAAATRQARTRIALGALALVLVAAGIVAASRLSPHNRPVDAPQVEATPAPSSTPGRQSLAQARNPGWQVLDNPAAGLTYEVPPDWTPAEADESLETSSGVTLNGLVDYGTYTCQGADYGRAFAAGGTDPTTGPAKAATRLAGSIAADQYSDGQQTAKVTVSKPAPLPGGHGVLVRATAASTGASDPCAGTEGTVLVVALSAGTGSAVFVVGADTVAGTQEPAPLADPARLDAIADSVRIGV